MPFPAKKNSAYVTYISLISRTTGQIQTTPTLAAGDVKVKTDTGSLGNISTLPTEEPAASGIVKVVLSASEMNGDNVQVKFSDVAGAEWADAMLNIQTSVSTIDDLSAALTAIATAISGSFVAPTTEVEASLNNQIREFVVGDDFNVERDVINVPVGATITKAWFTVKLNEYDADSDAVFQLDITATYVSGKGQITDDGADTIGHVSFEVSDTNSLLLTGDRIYYYDIQVLTSTSKLYTPEKGTILGRKQITRATS